MPFVTVGCKLPNGLHIEVNGKRVTLNGSNSSNVIGGHGLTQVDAEFFAKWLEDHKDYAPVKAGLIFAHEKSVNAEAEAKEKANNKSGLEGIDPENPGASIAPENYEGRKK
ncbi:hypothetical protein [Burkholderia multivorans]|uniref:hypothetical protein n=1 Tax=Burkholderia multivorans TaxID=87883 RepID=UPI000664EA48|nr:hypothetical protein [Burkholderia multivorans]